MGNSANNVNILASRELEPYIPEIRRMIQEQIDLRVAQIDIPRTVNINNTVPVIVTVNNDTITISPQNYHNPQDLRPESSYFDPTSFPIDLSIKLGETVAIDLLRSTAASQNYSYFAEFVSDFPQSFCEGVWKQGENKNVPNPLVELALSRMEHTSINPAFCHMTSFIKQELFANCKHSSGVRNMLTDEFYYGQISSNGVPHGFGTMFRPDGSLVEGFFEHGSPSIYIREVDAGGNLREGYYKNGRFRGSGFEIDASGTLRTDYSDLTEDGFIRQTRTIDLHAGRVVFEGQVKNGVKHGFVSVWVDTATSSTFQGRFVNGLLEGRGTRTYQNGDTYRGEFKAGREHGMGVLDFIDGRKWEGPFIHGRAHGCGSLYIPENGSTKPLVYQHGKKQL